MLPEWLLERFLADMADSIPSHRLQRRTRQKSRTRFPMRRCISVRCRQHTLGQGDVDALDRIGKVFGINLDNRPNPAFEIRIARMHVHRAGLRRGFAFVEHAFEVQEDGFTSLGHRFVEGISCREAAGLIGHDNAECVPVVAGFNRNGVAHLHDTNIVVLAIRD